LVPFFSTKLFRPGVLGAIRQVKMNLAVGYYHSSASLH
jgi:hypothetical protein